MAVKQAKKPVKRKKAPAPPKRVRRPRIEPFDAVIFDVDNVLIDTRASYLEAIRLTIDIYLTYGTVPFFELKTKPSTPYFLSAQDVEQFKMLGGFNDDWDCCYGLLVYLLNVNAGSRKASALKKKMDIPGFVKTVKERPLGVSGIVQMLGRPDGVKIERISRIFQEIYLGKSLFHIMRHLKAQYWSKRGLILKEKFIFRKSTFKRLNDMGIQLGIATGRPRFEALYALKNFNMLSHFEAMTTMDEVKKAESKARKSLRKPHPFSVLETAKKIGKNHRFLYVGDLPDDILAANRAKKEIDICSVAFPRFASNLKLARQQMDKVKPDFLLNKPGDLPKLVRSPASYVFSI